MQKRVTFILGLHNHQPVGNFDHIFEEAYEKAYLPFLEVMKTLPEFPFVMHNSGVLWDWLEDKHPEYIELLSSMVRRDQVEIMSGGYYEPILTVIPERDRQGQLGMMRDFIQGRFGAEPRGCWLTERIWEPHLPKSLERAGLEYVVVDDAHFKATGFGSEQMRGFFLSEEDGRYVRIFPIDKKLRYLIPFGEPAETIEYVRSVSREPGGGSKIVVLADDGEKFGLWPGTNARCYAEGWLERMCTLLLENADWIELSTFSRVIDACGPEGIVYLPTASYSEMMEWALPLSAGVRYRDAKKTLEGSGRFEEAAELLRGGFWRNFLVKYEESNWMHKRMLAVSEAVARLGEEGGKAEEARGHLYRAQCNCAYWHGLFGGLYLPHLRSAIYTHLIEAENAVEEASRGRAASIEHELRDIDGDGIEELIVSTGALRTFFKAKGGSLRELDIKSPAFNPTDTLTRRREIYHEDLVSADESKDAGRDGAVSIHDRVTAKEKGLNRHLRYDSRNRESLLDHFLDASVTFDDFAAGSYEEMGDFLGGLYRIEEGTGVKERAFTFTRKGRVIARGGPVTVEMVKRITLAAAEPVMEVAYEIRAVDAPLSCIFGVESVISMLAGDAPDRYYSFPGRSLKEKRLGSSAEERRVGGFRLVDEWMDIGIGIELEPAGSVWRYPVETVSNSESGFERVYQGSSVTTVWHLDLDRGATGQFVLRWSIGRAKGSVAE